MAEEALDEIVENEETVADEAKTDEVNDEVSAAEDEGTEEVTEEKEQPTKDHLIPKSRYDSAARRAREAERKVKEYEEQEAARAAEGKQETTSDLDDQLVELDKQIEQARLDGDVDKIVDLSRQARNVEKQVYQQIAEEAAQRSGTAAQESVKLDNLIDTLEAQHSILNPDSDNYNADLVEEILDMQSAFVAKGVSPSAAMLKAVGYILPEEAPSNDPAPRSRSTNVEKNLRTAGKQPPSSTDVGRDSPSAGKTDTSIDLTNMSQEEFDALPEETLKRLRGDAV